MKTDGTAAPNERLAEVARLVDPRAIFVAPGTEGDIVWRSDEQLSESSCGFARLFRFEFDESDNAMLWGARVRYWLDFAPGEHRRAAYIRSFIDDARAFILSHSADNPDRSLQIRWLSRDHEGSHALEAAGFEPLIHMACLPNIRSQASSSVDPTWQVGRALSSQIDAVASLIFELHRFETQLGAFRLPEFAAQHLLSNVVKSVNAGQMWVCRDASGEVIGCLELELNPNDTWISGALSFGSLALIRNVFVRDSVRGLGIASRLLANAASVLPSDTAGAVVYTAGNNTSSQFWNHRGFNPVWTTWIQAI